MNLERLPNEEKLSLCRKYYLGEKCILNYPEINVRDMHIYVVFLRCKLCILLKSP